MFAPLMTVRLRLRPFTAEDAECTHHFLGNEELAKQTGNLPYPFEIGEALDWIRSTIDDLACGSGYTPAVEKCLDGALLGAVGLLVVQGVPTRADLGYWVTRSYWGDGIATEAVECLIDYGRNKLGLNEVWVCVFLKNTGSQRVLEKKQNFMNQSPAWRTVLFEAVSVQSPITT